MPIKNTFNFDNSYSKLPENFYQRINPVPVKNPELITLNKKLCDELNLNLDNFDRQELAQIFSGNLLLEGSEPIALAYAGHQYGNFVPQLGDGRAILLGEIVNKNNERFDIQLKGSGQTKFSRRGDGRSALGPVIREYILSEAMNCLNIPSTRALAFVTTGENVYRNGYTPGGISTRVSSSHIRIGTFEYFASRHDFASLKILIDYSIKRHYPEVSTENNPYLLFLEKVIDRQAYLISKWMNLGFIHGVMNTDNVAISGQTIDYGPCAFMDNYDPKTVYSSIDSCGRYCFDNQPQIGLWNLENFASCIISLLDKEQKIAINLAEEKLKKFPILFKKYWKDEILKKIGINKELPGDSKLLEDLLKIMHSNSSDFTLTFRFLSESLVTNSANSRFQSLFKKTPGIDDWLLVWKKRIERQDISLVEIIKNMNKTNPIYIPRNHQVEKAIAFGLKNDFSFVDKLIKVLENPYEEKEGFEEYLMPPKPEEIVLETFCGT